MSGRGQKGEQEVRSSQQEARRRVILEALAEIVQEEGIHAFSVQKVADRAGLSHRTVYRYFPSREDLLEGLLQYTEGVGNPEGRTVPFSLDTLPHDMADLFDKFEQAATLVEATAVGALVMDSQPEARAARDRTAIEQVEASISPDHRVSAREAAGVIRYLANSLAWLVLRRQLGLDREGAQRAIEWALEVLLADLKKDDAGGPSTVA